MNPQTQAAILKALQDMIAEVQKAARSTADESLNSLNDAAGVTKLEVTVPGVTGPVASLTLNAPTGDTVAVTASGMLAWCRDRYPDEVETIEQVRPAFAKLLTGRLKVDEDGVVFDPETGERIDWARQVPEGPRRSTLTFAKGGREAIAAAYREGRLSLAELLAATPRELET